MELWDLVEKGYLDRDSDASRLRENKKKDVKALFFIQQAMHETIFSRIVSAAKAKEAWDILKTEFQGSAKVIEVQEGGSVQDFLSRVSGIVSQMRALGEAVPDKKIGSLLTHESRLRRTEEKTEDKAFHVVGESYNQRESTARGCGHVYRGRCGRGRGQRQSVQCHYCKRYGHVMENCWKRVNQASYVEEEIEGQEQEAKLFMAKIDDTKLVDDVWFLDSGCSNHMTGVKVMFTELD
ncbi:uncharacterized protein LOC141686482 [Apium graveolens]|uniref:uncharacterized protein LOC141686482 n=1 Tax=Apium graveolens TaxID=4045 RepID=UPI003D7A1666